LGGFAYNSAMSHGAAAMLAFLLLGQVPAAAQSSPRMSSVQAAPPSASGKEAEADVLDRIGRWFDRSVNDLNEGLKETFTAPPPAGDRPRDTSKDTVGSANSSADPLIPLPSLSIISQRQRCEMAANGAPDCRRAAEIACQSRGYSTGQSLQTQSERMCSPAPLFPQHASRPSGCRTEAYVLRAICR
jgi:hypothetical protein